MENERNIVIITFSQQQDDFTRCNNKINKNVKLSLDTGHSLYSYKYTIRLFSLVNKSKTRMIHSQNNYEYFSSQNCINLTKF